MTPGRTHARARGPRAWQWPGPGSIHIDRATWEHREKRGARLRGELVHMAGVFGGFALLLLWGASQDKKKKRSAASSSDEPAPKRATAPVGAAAAAANGDVALSV